MGPHSTESRLLVAGSDQYRTQFKISIQSHSYALLSTYPNPARGNVHIRFDIPYGSNQQIAFSIFDIMGRRVWKKKLNSILTAGQHTVIWNGTGTNSKRIGTGTYILQMDVVDANGKTVKRFDSRVNYVK